MADLISRKALVTKLSQGYWDRNLQQAKDDPCVIDAMIDWAIRIVNEMPLESPWYTGTPEKDGFYLCKVHYGDIPDDMRILEWVGDMGCFCLPESTIRGYHFYVGDEGVEVVYEWQRLTMRFRKEHGGWLEP